MSVLETPRVYFRGQISWDPIVTNNSDEYYDESDCETVYPEGEPFSEKVKRFRSDAIDAALGSVWNPQGTHRSTFFDSSITGADLGKGRVDDKFVGAPASFLGMLVDLEPYGSDTSQIFFDAMSFGIAGGCRIAARRRTRFTARYINFFRNPVGPIAGVASVVWQTCFRKEDLKIDVFDSNVLGDLKRALEQEEKEQEKPVLGLTVQWNAYRTEYYNYPFETNPELAQSPLKEELVAKMKAGGFQPNPARSMMVGVIGLWRKGEPVNEPGDRALLPMQPWPWWEKPPKVRPNDPPPPPPELAATHARLTGNSLTLDLSNSVSETGLDLTKKNLGELEVFVLDDQKHVTLARFGYADYDKAAYERTSGIVTLPVHPDAAAIARWTDIQLRDSTGKVLLAEAPYRVIPLVPNIYVNENEKWELGKKDEPNDDPDQEPGMVAFQVYKRGAMTDEDVWVTVSILHSDGSLEVYEASTAHTDGKVYLNGSFPPGISTYAAWCGPNPPPKITRTTGVNTQVYTYAYLRTLPADENLGNLKHPTWKDVYEGVLANWHAMAPCMDNWLNLGDEAQVRSFAPLLKKLTDEKRFEDYRYMPVTRDLTKGQRRMLHTFLDQPPTSVEAQTLEAEAPEAVNYAELSRRMRR